MSDKNPLVIHFYLLFLFIETFGCFVLLNLQIKPLDFFCFFFFFARMNRDCKHVETVQDRTRSTGQHICTFSVADLYNITLCRNIVGIYCLLQSIQIRFKNRGYYILYYNYYISCLVIAERILGILVMRSIFFI